MPLPPSIRSSPVPPMKVSFPSSPNSTSLPLPPEMKSAPPAPRTASLPPWAKMASALTVPKIECERSLSMIVDMNGYFQVQLDMNRLMFRSRSESSQEQRPVLFRNQADGFRYVIKNPPFLILVITTVSPEAIRVLLF